MGIFLDAITERRSGEMDLITNPSAWWAAVFGEVANDAGVTVNATTAMKYSPVLACTRILSETIAQVPFNVMRDLGKGKTEVASNTVEHRLLHRSPNALQTSFAFRVSLVANTVLHGNGYAWLKWNGAAKLDSIDFVPSTRVTIKQNKTTGSVFYEVEQLDGKKVDVNPDDMIHIPTLALDGVSGLSLIKQFEQGIGIGLAAEKFGASFLGKGARPAGLLYSEQPMGPEQQKETAEQWQKAYGGAGNAGKTPVLSGLKWQSITGSMEDAQYQQIREFQVAECARVFRIPGVFLGLKETSTYASAEQFFLSFVKFTIAPWAECIEQEFDRKLFRKDMSMYTHLDLRGLMRGDSASRVAYYKGMFDIGAMTSNIALAEEDMNPVEGGDRAYVQQNLMPVDMVDEVLKGKMSASAFANESNKQLKSVHSRWLESVVARIRGWHTVEKPKAVSALIPIFRSWADAEFADEFDVDAFCRQLAEDKFDDGFVSRATARFEEMITNV